MALVSTKRVEGSNRPWLQKVPDLVSCFFGDPVVDPGSGLLRRAREVHGPHSRFVVFG